ncbi:MAG: HAMP domain-containing sensor histidine kinase [Nitrospirota bacterium]
MVYRKRYYAIFIVISALFITYLHYSGVEGIRALHDIYRGLYFIPLLVGALVFGLKGAVLTYMLVAILHLSYILTSWSGIFVSEINRFLDLLIQGIFAFLAGFFIDRDKRRREQIEKEKYLAGIGQIATSIVHDLKTPLVTILGFAKRIQDGKGKTETAIETIIDSAENMQKIVNDVLDFSKPLQMDLQKDDIRNAVARACDFCREKANEADVSLSVELPSDALNIEIDRFHMERAIVNLINNAIEASDRGKKISVCAIPGKNHLSISIKDQGAGMDREILENVFIPFYTKKRKGTGLGMPIAKKVIEAHSGEISIESKVGSGTEVVIKLPYKPE